MSDDELLVASALRGDPSAWRAIYARYHARVRRLCQGFGGLGSGEVEDLVQETFIRAHARIDTLQQANRLRPWLLTIARNQALNRVEKGRREREGARRYLEDPGVGQLAPREDPEAGERAQAVEVVREIIDGLPAGPERETVELFYLEGSLSAREIAEQLGVGKSTVTMRLERFRARVKRRVIARVLRAQGETP